MPDRLLADLGNDGYCTISVWPEGGPWEVVSRSPFEWPLEVAALRDLRWYLEDYLRAPLGVWQERGPAIQARLPEWGGKIFDAVFASDVARNACQLAREHGHELVLQSSEPKLLGLPWELIWDQAGPAALSLAGISRALPAPDLGAAVEVPGNGLRVLMVIRRSGGTQDIPYRMIARRLLRSMEGVSGQVDLTVLRPPTLESLRDTLTEAVLAGSPFHIVHFDCHGSFETGEGQLTLEDRYGAPCSVSASMLTEAVSAGGVMVAVLNACQSGAVGQDVEAAVATALLRGGCASVVAMAYSVYAVTGAEFMTAFYESLFAGTTVGRAVAAGRRRLFEHRGRPSPKGEMPLADWMIPVHYWRRDLSFPQAQAIHPGLEPTGAELRAAAPQSHKAEGNLASVDSFVGRDATFYELESALPWDRVVVLHGPGGTGKTELAKAFGRWWRDTGGVDHPGWVLWQSFEPGVASLDLDDVIQTIGRVLGRGSFESLDADKRLDAVKNLLVQHRALLIWDNFETAYSMPDPDCITAPLDDQGRKELKEFLGWFAEHARSAMIITSRTTEDWLADVRRVRVGGLDSEEAAEYTEDLLAPFPTATQRRQSHKFGELLEWLDGNPLSMRLTIPRLDTADPDTLLAELQGITPLPLEFDPGADRTTSLAVSITYSCTHLTSRTRKLLPAVNLFQSIADAELLASFSRDPEVPERFASVAASDWTAALEDAARVGLLSPIPGRRMYRIHPALPAYLAAQWAAEDPGNHGAEIDICMRAMVRACAALGMRLNEQVRFGDAGPGFSVLDLLRRTFGRLLRYALDHEMWDQAQAIAQPLEPYWNRAGLGKEAGAWADEMMAATQNADGIPPSLTGSAGGLWVFAMSLKANQQLLAMRLRQADRIHRQVLDMIEDQPVTPMIQLNIAISCLQLGTIAKDGGQLGDANNWLSKALAIFEKLGDQLRMAVAYHQLGMVAELRQRPDDAERSYRISLALSEKLGNKSGMADTYFQLGVLGLKPGMREPHIAEGWFLRARLIYEELRDQPKMAKVDFELGAAAQLQGKLDQAIICYTEALLTMEELGNQPDETATAYHNLGYIAKQRCQLAEADDWYRKSLAIRESLGNRIRLAESYEALGELAETRKQLREALIWDIRCVTLFDEFPTRVTQRAAEQLARVGLNLDQYVLEESWREVTGETIPPNVLDRLPRLMWRGVGRDLLRFVGHKLTGPS